MRRSLSVSCLSLFALFTVAQEGVRRTPGGVPLPPAAAPGQEAARGIEKKDIWRAMVVVPNNAYSPADVQRFEASVRMLVDEIASSGKLTKADAARAAGDGGPGSALDSQTLQRLAAGKGAVFLSLSAWPSSAGNKQPGCPPQGCGCKEDGEGLSCLCAFYNGACLCALCIKRSAMSTMEAEDPVLTTKPTGRLAGPGHAESGGVIIVVAAPPDATPQLRSALAAQAVQTLRKEPWPEGLVIRTKSTPAYYEPQPAGNQ